MKKRISHMFPEIYHGYWGITYSKGIILNNKLQIIERLWVNFKLLVNHKFVASVSFTGTWCHDTCIHGWGKSKEGAARNLVFNLFRLHQELEKESEEYMLCPAHQDIYMDISGIINPVSG